MKDTPPPEGSIFLVPLRDGGFAVGVLARVSGEGHAFGYFFGPKVRSAEEINRGGLRAENALLVGKFGDLELLRGNWAVVGMLPDWDRSRWSMLPLARVDEISGKAWISKYDDMFNCIEEVEIDPSDAANFPYDRMMGAGSVEIRLTRLLQ